MTKSVNTVDEPQWMNEKECAEYIGMSVAFLRAGRTTESRCKHASGPAYYNFGRAIRYSRADVDKWLDDHRVAVEKVGRQRINKKLKTQ